MTNFKTVFLTKLGSILPGKCKWCGARATHLLTRIDKNDQKYEANVCDAHAADWDPYRQGTQIGMEIETW